MARKAGPCHVEVRERGRWKNYPTPMLSRGAAKKLIRDWELKSRYGKARVVCPRRKR